MLQLSCHAISCLNCLAFSLVVAVGSDWESLTEPNAFKSTTWELLYAIVKVQYFMHWSWSEGPCQVSIWLTEDQIDHWQGIARPPLSHLPFLSCLSGDTCTMSRSRRGEFHIRPHCLRETRDSQGGRGGARESWTEREIQGEGWLRQC